MLAAARPPVFDFLTNRVRVLANGSDTAGGVGLLETLEAPPGSMPPLHMHHDTDECFYVLEGEMVVHTPGEQVTLRPGDYLLAPRRVPHTYCVGDSPARWLTMCIPAGFERFVIAVGALAAPDPDAIDRIAAEHGIDILGPPGALPT